jgi:hypothetical protein
MSDALQLTLLVIAGLAFFYAAMFRSLGGLEENP